MHFRPGGSRLSRQKIKTFDNVFITFYFTLVLNLFSAILRGVHFFQGEVGVKIISIENFRNLWFSRGSEPQYPRPTGSAHVNSWSSYQPRDRLIDGVSPFCESCIILRNIRCDFNGVIKYF